MGDGEEESLSLLHDALDLLVGALQVLPIDTLSAVVAPDITY